MLIASQFLLWVVVALLVIAVLALSRQIGALRERLNPPSEPAAQTPAVGELAPLAQVLTLQGKPLAIGPGLSGRSGLLLFVAPTSTVCRRMIPTAQAMAAAESLDLVFIGDGDPADQRRMAERHRLAGYAFAHAPELGLAFHVGELPYAVLMDEDGRVTARGPVNTRERLAHLVAEHRPRAAASRISRGTAQVA